MNKTHPIFLSDTPSLDAQPDAAQPEWVRIDGEPTCLDCGSLEWSGHLANCPSRQRRAQPDNAPDEFRPRLGGGFELAGAPADELEATLADRQPDDAPDNAWRPIETAPKDGTWILLYPKDGNGVICTGSWATWRDGDSGWAAGGGWFEPNDVSHWIPLPDPPK